MSEESHLIQSFDHLDLKEDSDTLNDSSSPLPDVNAYIKSVSLTNVGQFYTLSEFEFGRGLTVLSGLNNSGKTTVIQALSLYMTFISDDNKELLERLVKRLSRGFGQDGTQRLNMVISVDRNIRPSFIKELKIKKIDGQCFLSCTLLTSASTLL
eukprot:gene11562-13495_t